MMKLLLKLSLIICYNKLRTLVYKGANSMTRLYTDEMLDIIINEYPNSNNKILADRLGISEGTLRWKASQLGIRKNDDFMKDYYLKLQTSRKLKQEENYKDYQMTNIERNIIIGSLLGDGTLSKYGRSLNACYRENTGPNQVAYRKWKADRLSNLDFKSNAKGAIYSPSHPIYTDLYDLFYPDGKKIIPRKGLEILSHPIGLACLFMDDGSLVINNYKKSNTITLFPQIIFYSQSFTKEENILLKERIKNIFNVSLKLSTRNDGSNYILKINERNEVYKFLDIVEPYVNEIPEMKYKIDVESKLIDTKLKYLDKYPDKTINIASRIAFDNSYSKDDELKILEMIDGGFSYKDIADKLDRSYYGLYDKIRRMNIK